MYAKRDFPARTNIFISYFLDAFEGCIDVLHWISFWPVLFFDMYNIINEYIYRQVLFIGFSHRIWCLEKSD